ncbi:MAG: tetratricopeptide repeat protein [Acidobacteriota bacterium]
MTVGRRATVAAALFLVALGLRLLYLHQAAAGPFWERPVLDEAYNHDWAARLAAGESGPAPPYFRAPLYPWFLAAVYRATGAVPGHARLVQAVLSALTCLGIAALARRLYGGIAAVGAGMLAAAYWPWIYFDGELQDVPLTLALDVAALLVLLRVEGSRRSGLAAAGGGLLLGLSAIARPTILIAVPAVAWWLWRTGPAARRRRLARPLALTLGLALPILPITAVNLLVGGDRVLIASQGGLNFYLGNNPDSDGHSARLPGASAEWEAMIREGTRRAETAAGRALRPSEVSRYWFREGLGYWASDPGGALALTARKAGMLLAAPELPNNKQIRFFTRRASPLMRLPWPDFGLVAPLALLGLLWGRAGPRGRLLWGVAASYAVGVVAFFVAARFRMPLAALLLVPAGGGLQVLWRLAREGGGRRLAPALAVLAAAGIAVNLPRLGYRENEAHAHYMLGNAFRDDGDAAAAAREFAAALDLDPGFREARRNLGATLIRSGRSPEAVALLTAALAEDPADVPSRVNLALALADLGREEQALVELEAAARREPSPETLIPLGNLRASLGDPRGASAAFEAALRLDPSSTAARFNLGNARLLGGEPAAAAQAYRAVLEGEPDHAGAWINLGVALLRLDRPAEAVEALRRGLLGEPANLPARLALADALRATGRPAEARRELETVLRDAPEGSEPWRRAGEGLAALDGPGVSR